MALIQGTRNLTIGEAMGGQETQQQFMEDSLLTSLRVAIPGVVDEFFPDMGTVNVQPVIMEWVKTSIFSSEAVALPLLQDVPVCFPQAGGYRITFPIKKGDECLVIFADMCIDSWWQNGGKDANGNILPQTQAEVRRHDLSDGFAIMAPSSLPTMLNKSINTESMVIEGEGTILVNGVDLNRFFNHTHTVRIGDNTYTSSVPNY